MVGLNDCRYEKCNELFLVFKRACTSNTLNPIHLKPKTLNPYIDATLHPGDE